MKLCSIVVPVYNEELSIAKTLSELSAIVSNIPGWKFEIICVDDGSTDSSLQIIKSYNNVLCVEHTVNRGYGAALKSGLDVASGDWLFITDADNTYSIEDLARLLDFATTDYSMVVGDRKGLGISANPFKRIARWVLRKFVHALTGIMVPDLNSGLRVFNKSIYLQFKHLLPHGFSFTTTITVCCLYSCYKIKYIPTAYHIRSGKSNIKPVKDFIAFSILILRLATYFDPLRFFLPISYGIFLLGGIRAIRDIIITQHIGGLSILLIVLGFNVLSVGLLADVLVRRTNVK